MAWRLLWAPGPALEGGAEAGSTGMCLPHEHPPPTCSLLQPRGSPTDSNTSSTSSTFAPWQKPSCASVFPSVEWGWDSSPGRPHGGIPVGWRLQVRSLGEADPILV